MSSDGPPLLRPTPRRPFDLHLTASSDSSIPASPNSQDAKSEQVSDSGAETPGTFSRTKSILNLTSSTLFGIYSPTSYNGEKEEPSTPWGFGAETPSHRPSVDGGVNPMFASRVSESLHRRNLSQHITQPPSSPLSFMVRILSLFVLGMGYGLLVTHLHDDQRVAAFEVEGILKPSYNWPYLIFWGIAGVGLGSLLPFVDGFFSENAQTSHVSKSMQERAVSPEVDGAEGQDGGLAADWNPVVRSIGAFVGIAFAIRKLPWTSTLQVSLTLALVNPVLWYLIDRSKPGFLLSTSVGVVGTAVLLSLNPEMMPSPASSPSLLTLNSTAPPVVQALSGIMTQRTIECGTWIISVLFCSTVCFGNIGRRLALRTGRSRQNSFR